MHGRFLSSLSSLRIAALALFGVWLSAVAGAVSGQVNDLRYYALVDGSSLTISGSTNINRFLCSTDDLNGGAALAANAFVSGEAANDAAVLAAEVNAFQCDVRRVENDLVRVLRGDGEHDIHFEITKATLLAEPAGHEGWHEVFVEGDIQPGASGDRSRCR